MNEQLFLRKRGFADAGTGPADFYLFLRFFGHFLEFGTKFLESGAKFLRFGAKFLEFGTSLTFFKGNFAAPLHTYSHSPLLCLRGGRLGAVLKSEHPLEGGDFCDVIS